MKKLLLLAAFCAAFSAVHADTSYLLIQGPFGLSAAVQTHLWKVLYEPGSLSTSQDLLDAVFGLKSDTGTTHLDAYGTPRPYYTAGNATLGVGYQYYASFSAFLIESFAIGGTYAVQDGDGTPAWSSYVAGGTGQYATPSYEPGAYPQGSWAFSNDGLATRGLSNGSFDGWVFGAAFPEPSAEIAGGSDIYAPSSANFAGATVVNVPEPGAGLLLLAGLAGFSIRRRR
jgi:hypothetical protein